MPAILVTAADGAECALDAAEDDIVMHVVRDAGLAMAGECEASMACGTCHCIVDPAWAGRLAPPGEEERAMLDALFDREPTSRLGCQIRLAAALDGLRLRLPA
jgi:2Fe-2S ferredoxin